MLNTVDVEGKTWTIGAEHEMADWDTTKGWDGFGRDPKERNIVNSNGIAVDPSLRIYKFGAEVNTLPTVTVEGQAEEFAKFLRLHKDASMNWRCGMHIHIRVPGLKDNLFLLKKLARYVFDNSGIYDLIDPLLRASRIQHKTAVELKEATRRYNWMRMSHMTVIPEYRVAAQEKAATIREFMELEVPRSRKGIPLWHAQSRAAVNIRQLLQTDTIEFRHFPQTMNPEEVITAANWCRDYLLSAFDNYPAKTLYDSKYNKVKFPTLDTIYVHWQEMRWRATSISKVGLKTAKQNIATILEEEKHGIRETTTFVVANITTQDSRVFS